MMQKFVKELHNSAKQPDRSDSAESTATEQVEMTAGEIAYEAVQLSRNAGRRSGRRESMNSAVHATPEQTAPPRDAPDIPRQRIDDLRTKPESKPPQRTPTPAPPDQARRVFLNQVKASRAEKGSVRDPLFSEKPEIREKPHLPEHSTVSAESAKPQPVSHIRQAGEWIPRPATPQAANSKAPSAGYERHIPPTLQAQMRQAFVKTQTQRSQNSSIASIDPSKPAVPILPQPPAPDMLAITPERQPVTAGSKPISAQSVPSEVLPPSTSMEQLPSIREKPNPNAAPREKPRRGIWVKTREAVLSYIPKTQSDTTRTVPKTATAQARRHATQKAQHQMLKKSSRAAKTAAAAGKRLAESAAKAGKELIGALAGLGGGVALLVVFCVLIVAGALLSSPLGILFADEQKNADTVPLATAIAEIQGEYHIELERLQNGDFASVQIVGQAPDWREVVAVFASKTAGADDGVDVFTLDEARVELLRQVFWDMCEISTDTQTVVIPDSDPDDGIDDSHTETALTITITAKTAEQMRLEYAFSNYQNDALDILLENLSALHVPMGALTISQEEAKELLENLPAELDSKRKAVVETALQLVGRVTYFWGGKSLVLGWDDRWGIPTEVTAEGSGSTGTVRPFGLDCSGFVDWVFFNATSGAYYPGRGGGAATQHSYCENIPWNEAQPGDLVFYPDNSHVGIVGGADADGNLLIIHCSGGANGVVITGAAGFTIAAKPDYWG